MHRHKIEGNVMIFARISLAKFLANFATWKTYKTAVALEELRKIK